MKNDMRGKLLYYCLKKGFSVPTVIAPPLYLAPRSFIYLTQGQMVANKLQKKYPIIINNNTNFRKANANSKFTILLLLTR